MLVHTVFFSLKDRSAAAAARLLDGCRRYLTGHTGTVFCAAGTCADYDGQANDRDWDVTITIVFESHADHDRYQVDARHEQFIAEHAATWARVRVFDADAD
jgi:hypothetical protein